jgi:hypothetical protein
MTEEIETTDTNKESMLTLRFGTSDKFIHLTQQQLDCIPYLAALVAHKDDMSSIQNENGEYVLNPPIHYNWFMPILHSITSKNPYTLFNELPEDNNILDTLQLFDYLSINSFPLPLLKDEILMRSNSTNAEDSKTSIKYHKANLSEARQTAAEFVIALAKNEYKLSDSNINESIFTLINIVLFNPAIFNSRFRHHTLTVVKTCCYSFFSKTQQHQVQTTHRIAQYRKTNSSVYLSDDVKSLPDKFQNTFGWRGVYVPIEENRTDSLPVNSSNTASTSMWEGLLDFDYELMLPISSLNFETNFSELRYISWRDYRESIIYWERTPDVRELPIYKTKQNQKNNEAQLARSGRLNTLPKRPNVDKFKHRFGPKTQKYR